MLQIHSKLIIKNNMINLKILCSGTPTPSEIRWGSSYALQVNNEWFMFDCGPAATYKLTKAGISPLEVTNMFFTHHHSDHDADYACFLLMRFDQSIGKEKILNVYGPPPTEQLTKRLVGEDIGAYWHDYIARTNHPLSLWAYQDRGGELPRQIPQINSNDIDPGFVLNGENWKITCKRVEHVQPYLDSLAYRVEHKNQTIVFSGDTRPCEALVDISANADALVMECARLDREMKGNATSQSESSALDAGKVAKEANVKNLILTHQVHYLDEYKDEVINEVELNFKGNIIWADELMTIKI